MDDHDELVAALRTCAAAPITLASLPSLSSSELALASLRPDLPALVRQRAYHALMVRKTAYHAHNGPQKRDPILEVNLDFAVSCSLPELELEKLLVLQFSPVCQTPEMADAAGREVCERIRLARGDGDARLELRVLKGLLSWEGGERVEEGLNVRLDEDGLRLAQAGDEEGYMLEGAQMREVLYIAGRDDGHNSMECTLSLFLSHVALSSAVSLSDCTVRLELGMLASGDEAFLALRKKVAKWAEQCGFEVKVVRAPDVDLTPRSSRSPSTTAPPRNLAAPSSAALDRPRSTSLPAPASPASHHPPRPKKRASAPDADLPSRARKKSRSPPDTRDWDDEEEQTRGARDDRLKECWRFVGTKRAEAEWTPGFYVPQFALLRSIAPLYPFPCPSFSPHETALLSFAPDADRLPPLPPHVGPEVEEREGWGRHEARERLALEHVFREKVGRGRVDLSVTRQILLSPSLALRSPVFGALRTYLGAVAKVIEARDALREAYAYVAGEVIEVRRRDKGTKDPLERIARRLALFTTSSNRLVTRPATELTTHTLGTGPLRRFAQRLGEIVEWEERAVSEFAPPRESKSEATRPGGEEGKWD